jgi:hypothetical protein
MMRTLLTLRISRRAIGAAVLADDGITFADGRHVSSRPNRSVVAAMKYIEKVVAVTHATCVAVDAPARVEGHLTDRIVRSLESLTTERGIPLMTVEKPEVLMAYGRRGLKHRREVRDIVRGWWPALSRISGRVEPYVIDAAAAGLYVECRMRFESPSP